MTQPDVQRDVPARFGWRFAVGASAACAVLGLLAVGAGAALPAPIATLALGAGIVGASFLLSWAGDAAEVDISGGWSSPGSPFSRCCRSS